MDPACNAGLPLSFACFFLSCLVLPNRDSRRRNREMPSAADSAKISSLRIGTVALPPFDVQLNFFSLSPLPYLEKTETSLGDIIL